MKKISLGGVALVCAFCSLYAQDPRERNYFYEILDPKPVSYTHLTLPTKA